MKTRKVHPPGELSHAAIMRRVKRHIYFEYTSPVVAHWAAFYDLLGLNYIYQPNAMNERNLPHFIMPDMKIAIRIDVEGLGNWAEGPKDPTIDTYFFGPVPDTSEAEWYRRPADHAAEFDLPTLFFSENILMGTSDCGHVWYAEGGWDHRQWWCRCPMCGNFGIAYEGRGHRVCKNKCCPHDDKGRNGNGEYMSTLYTAVREFTRMEWS